MSLLASLATGYSIFVGVILVIWWTTGERFAPINLCVNLMPALFYPAPILLVLLVLGGEWDAVAWAMVIMLIFLGMYASAWLPRVVELPAEPDQLTVLTYNMWARNDDPKAVHAVLKKSQADVVALQEVPDDFMMYADEHLRDQYPYQAIRRDPGPIQYDGRMVLSRFPIKSVQATAAIGRKLLYLRAEIDLAGQPVAFYSVHLCPVTVQGGFSTAYRHEDLSLLLEDLADDNLPKMILGDFNMTDTTQDYHLMVARYGDAYRDSVPGLGTSYPNWDIFMPGMSVLPGGIRIDYIFVDDFFRSVDAGVIRGGKSDHRPVWARLHINV